MDSVRKKRNRSLSRSLLREQLLQRTARGKEFWEEPSSAERRQLHWGNVPGQLLRPLHEHFFEKTVAATLAVIFFGLFSLLDFPLTNRITDTARYLTVHETSAEKVLEQVRPVVASFRDFDWRRQPGVVEDTPAEETMAAPVSGVLLSPYGTRLDASGQRLEMNYGIDVAAEAGTPVYAALSGTVMLVQEHPIHGLTVYLAHGEDLRTIYSGLADPQVVAGDTVRQGEQLAVVAAHHSGQDFLHFEVWKEGRPVNPQEFMGPLH